MAILVCCGVYKIDYIFFLSLSGKYRLMTVVEEKCICFYFYV